MQVTFLAAVVLGVVGATVNRHWAFDIWSYLAAVTEFQHSGLAATNSLTVNAGADPFLSPYTLLVGTSARVLGLGSLTAISIAGVLNVLYLLIALYWFAASFVRSTTAGFSLVVATLVLWGVDPWQWAGYFNLSSIGRVAPLGSTFASATGITALGCIQRWLRHDGHLAQVVVVAVLLATTVLVHPMTALWVGLVAFGIWAGPGASWRKRWIIALAVLAGGATTLLWPYYWVPDLVSGSADVGPTNLGVFRGVIRRSFLALPAIVVVALRYRDRRLQPLIISFLIVTSAFVYGWIVQDGILGRTFPGVMLCAHMLIVMELIRLLEARSWAFDSIGRVVAGTAIVGVLALGSARGAVRMIPYPLWPESLLERITPAEINWYVKAMPGPIVRDDVIAASPDIALGVGALSAKAIRPPMRPPLWSKAEIARRDEQQAELFRAGLSWPVRRDELSKAGVDWLVLNDADLSEMAPPAADVIRTPSDGITIVRVGGHG